MSTEHDPRPGSKVIQMSLVPARKQPDKRDREALKPVQAAQNSPNEGDVEKDKQALGAIEPDAKRDETLEAILIERVNSDLDDARARMTEALKAFADGFDEAEAAFVIVYWCALRKTMRLYRSGKLLTFKIATSKRSGRVVEAVIAGLVIKVIWALAVAAGAG